MINTKTSQKVENIFHFQRQKNVFYRSFVHSCLPFLCAACQHNSISHNYYSDTTDITTIAHHYHTIFYFIIQIIYFVVKKNYICFASNTWSVNLILINPQYNLNYDKSIVNLIIYLNTIILTMIKELHDHGKYYS